MIDFRHDNDSVIFSLSIKFQVLEKLADLAHSHSTIQLVKTMNVLE